MARRRRAGRSNNSNPAEPTPPDHLRDQLQDIKVIDLARERIGRESGLIPWMLTGSILLFCWAVLSFSILLIAISIGALTYVFGPSGPYAERKAQKAKMKKRLADIQARVEYIQPDQRLAVFGFVKANKNAITLSSVAIELKGHFKDELTPHGVWTRLGKYKRLGVVSVAADGQINTDLDFFKSQYWFEDVQRRGAPNEVIQNALKNLQVVEATEKVELEPGREVKF